MFDLEVIISFVVALDLSTCSHNPVVTLRSKCVLTINPSFTLLPAVGRK